jgi:hypothetical protein
MSEIAQMTFNPYVYANASLQPGPVMCLYLDCADINRPRAKQWV